VIPDLIAAMGTEPKIHVFILPSDGPVHPRSRAPRFFGLLRETEFARRGFPLKRGPNSNGGFVPHCSVALLYSGCARHFQNPELLSRLDGITGLRDNTTQKIILEPVQIDNLVQTR
jgi:hypothetical protein